MWAWCSTQVAYRGAEQYSELDSTLNKRSKSSLSPGVQYAIQYDTVALAKSDPSLAQPRNVTTTSRINLPLAFGKCSSSRGEAGPCITSSLSKSTAKSRSRPWAQVGRMLLAPQGELNQPVTGVKREPGPRGASAIKSNHILAFLPRPLNGHSFPLSATANQSSSAHLLILHSTVPTWPLESKA